MKPSRAVIRQLKAVEAMATDYTALVAQLTAMNDKLAALETQVVALSAKLDGVLPKAEIKAVSAPTVRKR